MPIESRPYIGTWKLNNQQLVQHTPDALVYLNGDLALPGCQKCSGKIDIQQFLTEVSVDAGTEAGSHSATFSLAIPLHHTESFARNAQFILRPGLEVHIYMRGYFPVRGLYSNLAEKKAASAVDGSGAAPPTKAQVLAPERQSLPPEVVTSLQRLRLDGEQFEHANLIYGKFLEAGYTPAFATAAILQSYSESGLRNIQQVGGPGLGLFQVDPGGLGKPVAAFQDGKAAGSEDTDTTWNALDPRQNIDREILAVERIGGGLKKSATNSRATIQDCFAQFFGNPTGLGARNPKVLPRKNKTTRYTREEWEAKWDAGMSERSTRGSKVFGSLWNDPQFNARIRAAQGVAPKPPQPNPVTFEAPDGTKAELPLGDQPPVQGNFEPSLLEEMGLDGMGIENTLAYPYYHVFHGVVTSVNHSYSGGVSTISVTCNSMLHFWQYHNMSTNASVFGARPTNSKNKMSLVGNNFTGMHPYAIIYSLHYDMAGAAGGIGFALSDKSNQGAVSEGGESLFSLNVQYWERRFKRGTKLRMHAASGELFTTMAAAWLSRKDSGALTAALRDRYSTKKEFTRKNIASEMVAVGLWSGPDKRNAIDATRFAAQSQAVPRSASFEVNILEMQAFVSNIGEWGQVNLFESSYESKLDVAQKVCQITGFEFYQDVDGDFVFKPPMWNLDTSSSRVYRIEDVDIISISFSEKEPQVTYMTVKGSQFKNTLGTGTENEWGVRGQYIDYRLVAQFGWRPGSYETSYFNDPKSMFFAAVNRMDVMNIANNSASVTIPVRPEFRPGYPVYIPYLDCFYYCNSFAHSHSVGGQCTTALQLVGKRAKFYAPGEVNKTGVSSINLADTRLPEKPLQVVGEDGRPRLAGFPNVVMALDPSEVNPLFFVVGLDIENISDTRVLSYMVQVGAKLGVIKKDEDGQGGYTINRQTGTGVVPVRFFFDPSEAPPKKSGDNGQPVNLQSAANNYMALLASYEKSDEASLQERSAAQTAVNQAQTTLSSLLRDPDAKPAKVTAATTAVETAKRKLAEIDKKLSAQKTQRETDMRDFDKKPEVALLLTVYDLTAKEYRASAGYQAGNRGDLTSTVNLLDMLSDKKAIFTNGQQPGQYRYYSASHPEAEMQGPKTIKYEGRVLKTGEPLQVADPPTVRMFNDLAPAPFPGARPPETSLVPGRPKVGIKVLTGKPDSDGEVLATSDITELMFSVQEVNTVRKATATKKQSKPAAVSPQVLQKTLAQVVVPEGVPSADQAVSVALAPGIQTVVGKAQAGLEALKAAVGAKGLALPSVPDSYFEVYPTQINIGTGFVDLNVPFGEYKWEGNTTGSNSISLGSRMDRLVATEWLQRVGAAWAEAFAWYTARMWALVKHDLKGVGQRPTGSKSSFKIIGERGFNTSPMFDAVVAWNTTFTFGESHAAVTEQRTSEQVIKKETTYSPVFPISDANGYRVIGSYRYGRGVDIDPSGVFDQLHKYDLFSLLDRNLVDQILRVFVQGEKIKIPYEEKEINGKKVTVPVGELHEVGGSEAARYLNNEALRQLRAANLTDAQILDFSGALIKKEGASQLDFSLAKFAESKRDGVMKVPVNNAAFSLADLGVQQAGHICNCKASEASMLIEAFGQQEFLDVAAEEADADDMSPALNSWMQTQGELAAAQWELQQQTLRGQVLDRGGSHAVQSFLDATGIDTPGQRRQSPFEAAIEDSEARASALRAEARKVPTQAENIITGRNRDQ